jgi:hypothetical protein
MAHQIIFGSDTRPLKIDSADLPCFILDNLDGVFSLSGIQKALGYDGKSENWLKDLLNHIHRFIPIDQLLETLDNAPVFEIPSFSQRNVGISPEWFMDICQTIARAKKEGFLNLNQLKYAKSAEILVGQLNGKNLRLAIEETTGFRFYKENAIDQFSQFLVKTLEDSAFEWTRTIPEAFFLRIFELHGYDWPDLQKNPKLVGKILYDIIFSRIPNDLLEELRNAKPKRSYHRKGHLPQDNLHPKLREYLSNVLALIKAAGDNWNIFLQLLNRSYPKNTAFTTKFPSILATSPKNEDLSAFNQTLKIMS